MSTSFLLPLELPHPEVALHDAKSEGEEARWVAALSLGRVRGPLQQQAFETLLYLTRDPVEEVRAQALESIAEQVRGGAVSVPEQMVHAALRDPSPGVRCAAIDTALEVLKDPIPAIARGTKDKDPSVRAAAAMALGSVDAYDKADQLAALLADPDEFVCRQSAIALARLRDSRAEPVLLAWLKSEKPSGDEAVFALGLLGASSALPELRKIARGRFLSVELKSMLAAAMVRCGDEQGRTMLLKLLRARRERTRMAVLSTLARMPIQGMAATVGGLMDTGDGIEASSAIQTLLALAAVDREVVLKELEKRLGQLGPDLDEELKDAVSSLDLLA